MAHKESSYNRRGLFAGRQLFGARFAKRTFTTKSSTLQPSPLSSTYAAMEDLKAIPLRKINSAEVSEAVRVCEDAFEDDPLQHYFRYTPDADDDQRWRKNWHKLMGGYTKTFTDVGLGWTTDDFGAVLFYSPVKPPDVDRKSILGGSSEEQQKRVNEWTKTSERVADETLGESRKDMAYIALLATKPIQQGRGYASALVKMAVDEADAQGRITWLLSSNIANTGFYNSHGFIAKAKITLGEDNPTWNRPPVEICLKSWCN
ncbi:hypothetical protein BC835DRAFT_366192 [Cytidiella melzeri]|nr:hypothetical protein BC835DRAFT_366192 [Cytidiella melzeri]